MGLGSAVLPQICVSEEQPGGARRGRVSADAGDESGDGAGGESVCDRLLSGQVRANTHSSYSVFREIC